MALDPPFRLDPWQNPVKEITTSGGIWPSPHYLYSGGRFEITYSGAGGVGGWIGGVDLPSTTSPSHVVEFFIDRERESAYWQGSIGGEMGYMTGTPQGGSGFSWTGWPRNFTVQASGLQVVASLDGDDGHFISSADFSDWVLHVTGPMPAYDFYPTDITIGPLLPGLGFPNSYYHAFTVHFARSGPDYI